MTYSLSPVGFRKNGDSNSCSQRTLTTELIEDDAAVHKQNNSLQEYQATHVHESLAPEIRYLVDCFRLFINYHLPRPITRTTSFSEKDCHPYDKSLELTVLDVGCGISNRVPLYFRDIADQGRAMYVGLDPLEVITERDYIFINGKFEGLHRFLHHKFDCLIFSTSLDHFPDLDLVNQEIHRMLKPNGVAIFWVGVHDPSIVSEKLFSDSFRMFSILSISKVLRRAISFPVSIIRMHFMMKRRNSKLLSRMSLDSLHFHYFTESSLKAFMETVGTVIDCQHVRTTNSFFYAVRING